MSSELNSDEAKRIAEQLFASAGSSECESLSLMAAWCSVTVLRSSFSVNALAAHGAEIRQYVKLKT